MVQTMDGDEHDDGLTYEARELRRGLGLDQGYSPESVAQALDVNISTVYRWLQSGQLKGKQFGKQWTISFEEVKDFTLKQQKSRETNIAANRALQRIQRIRPDEEWRLESCVICGLPIVTDGAESPEGREVAVRDSQGNVFFACSDFFGVGCLAKLASIVKAGDRRSLREEGVPFE